MRIIRGKYGHRRFNVPSNITARPTTDFARENIFNVIENLIDIEGIEALDLFAGTGAISFELLSRGAATVTAIEKASTQLRFIEKIAKQLDERNLRLIRGDVFKYMDITPKQAFDFIWADPPYDMPRFEEIPERVLSSDILRPGGLFIIEHSRTRNFAQLPHFHSHRAYGSVNFSLFLLPDNDS